MAVNFVQMSKLLARVDFNSKSLSRIYCCQHVTSLAHLALPSTLSFQFQPFNIRKSRSRRRHRREMASPTAALLVFSQNPVVGDVVATALTGAIALFSLRVWEETARRGLFDQVILKYFVCWSELCPLYPSYTSRFSDSLLDYKYKYYLVYWIFNLSVWVFLTYSSYYGTLQKIAQQNIKKVFIRNIFWGIFLLKSLFCTWNVKYGFPRI